MTTRTSTNVLCVVDSTPASDAALLAAIELADRRGSDLIVATCAPPPGQRCGRCFSASKWDELMKELCAAELEHAAEIAATADTQAQLVVLEGCGPRMIARAAETRGCDAIVVAARHGRWSSWPRALRRHARAEVFAVDPRRVPPAPLVGGSNSLEAA
jgi:nucleotide-binding universal stress UspA family protein